MPHYKKFPYRSEFPDSSEGARSHQTLEDALYWARWKVHRVWRETNEYGLEGDYIYDAPRAIITNRNTGYRWILRRDDHHVEFQTPEMFEDAVAHAAIELHLTVEEAEALAVAIKLEAIADKHIRALASQALDQIALVCREIRERARIADAFTEQPPTRILRKATPAATDEADEPSEDIGPPPQTRYRPLGDPDNLTLKEAGEILGKARNTVYGWYRKGKFPPALDVGRYIPGTNNPVIVVPRYRLGAWQAGERMPEIFQSVFETRHLREPPWACYVPAKGANRVDVEFWIERRALLKGLSKDGKQVYGDALEEGKVYELVPTP